MPKYNEANLYFTVKTTVFKQYITPKAFFYLVIMYIFKKIPAVLFFVINVE